VSRHNQKLSSIPQLPASRPATGNGQCRARSRQAFGNPPIPFPPFPGAHERSSSQLWNRADSACRAESAHASAPSAALARRDKYPHGVVTTTPAPDCIRHPRPHVSTMVLKHAQRRPRAPMPRPPTRPLHRAKVHRARSAVRPCFEELQIAGGWGGCWAGRGMQGGGEHEDEGAGDAGPARSGHARLNSRG
jgi:hypothetical protein